jgi:hypothetical protein
MTGISSCQGGGRRAASTLFPVQKLSLLPILLITAVSYPSCQAFQAPLHVPVSAGAVARRNNGANARSSLTSTAFSRGATSAVQSDHTAVSRGRSHANVVGLSMRFIPTDEVRSNDDDNDGSPTTIATTSQLSVDPKSRAGTANPLQGSDLVQLSIWPHAPLGCVVEESLATYDDDDDDDDKDASSALPHPPLYVFVSALKAGGHAERAGLRVGDVLVECTDLFGQLTDATRLGVEKVYV